jgi:hypothetical protein
LFNETHSLRQLTGKLLADCRRFLGVACCSGITVDIENSPNGRLEPATSGLWKAVATGKRLAVIPLADSAASTLTISSTEPESTT